MVHFLSKYKFTILFLIFLLLITCFTSDKRINLTLIVAACTSTTILFVQNILAKTKYTLPATIILIIILSFDAFFAFIYKSYLTIFILGSILETDHIEAREALNIFAGTSFLIIAVTSYLVIFSQKELKKNSLISRKASLSILIIYFLLVIPPAIYIKLKRDNGARNYISLDPLLTIESTLKTITPVFYGDFSTFGVYQYRKWPLRAFVKHERTLPVGITSDESKDVPEKIYFIIGETARRDHMSLYGYTINTTPFLDSLYQTGTSGFNFYKGIAPAPLTREALRIVLSYASPLDEKPFYKSKNIVELAKDAGYATYWISNHDKMTLSDGYVGFISSQSGYTSFRNRLHQGKPEDLNLVKLVSAKSKKGKKQIFFIHLIGSHSAYDQRYDDTDRKSITGSGIITDYDRSIHHTDRVLRNTFELMKADSSAVMLYFSDHGEVIGKGHSMGWLQDYTVPLLLISNDTTIVNPTYIVDKYVDEETGLINTSSIIYIASEILGYKVRDEIIRKSKADGKYVLNKMYLPEKFSNIKSYQ